MELHWLSILVITIMVSNSQTQSYYNTHPGSNSYQRVNPYVVPYQVPGRHQGHHVQYPPLVGPYQVPGRHQGHHVQYPSLVGHIQPSPLDKSENSPLTDSKTSVDELQASKIDQLYKALRQQQEDTIKVKTVILSLKTALTPLITLLQEVDDDNDEAVSYIHGK